jgi:ATP-binding cassette subfamily C (CFTR/MRP) protein 1
MIPFHSKSLWVALAAAYGNTYLVAGCSKFFSDSLTFVQPQLLRLFLVFISSYQDARRVGSGRSASDASMGFLIAVLMYFTAVSQSVILNQVHPSPPIPSRI